MYWVGERCIDVYKRQLPHQLAVVLYDLDLAIIAAHLTVVAVSYTHLDVYKRQSED